MIKHIFTIISVCCFSAMLGQTISIIGTATAWNDWNGDIVLTPSGSGIYTGTLPLYAGTTFGAPNAVKFRTTGNWATNWGDNDNAFPMGTGAQDEGNIDIPVSGYYDVTINTATGAYTFAPHNTIIYVNDDASTALGDNHGQDWDNAYVSLQDALALAHWFTSVEEIWVAAGTYKPSAYPHGCSGCGTTRDYTFHLRDGLKIYGGFAGTETSITGRNIAANPTILSGDYNDDDVVTGGGATLSITGNGENAHHVVLASAHETTGIGVTVDGFSITSGNANYLSFMTVNGNTADRYDGGGISTSYGTNTLTNNTLYNNSAYWAGGILTYHGTNTLTNNTLYNNSVYISGGGICTNEGTNTLTNNTLYNNSAVYGGGIYTGSGTNTLTNNTLHNNSVDYGGGIYTDGGMNTLKNNLFWANQKAGNSGIPGSDYENSSTDPSTNTFENNMLQLPNNTTNYPTTGGTTYTNNIYATDPLFINPADPDGADNLYRTADDGLSIQPCSPAINAGTATGAPIEDITGYTRTGVPDIGAYEYNPTAIPSTIYVNAYATGSNNGTSWADAFTSLQSALAKAHACPDIQEVWVAAGTYKPSAYPQGCSGCATDRDYTFHLRDGLKIYGGFAGMETSITARNIAANPTILSGDYNDDDVVTGSGATLSITGNGENAHHVVLASADATTGIGVTVDGFSITGGNGNADFSSYITFNGNNVYRSSGGGIYTGYGTNTLTNNTLYNNSANYSGGGIYTEYGTNTLANNTLYNNSADDYGGGIETYYGTNTLTNNTLYNNSAAVHGGGIYTQYGINTLANNTLYNNSANYSGGIYTYYGTNILTNNTLYNNSANYSGGGIITWSGTNTLKNNIFWANQKAGSSTTAGADYENSTTLSATNTFENNMLQLPNNTTNYPTTGGTTYTNNIYATDPLFINPADPDGADNIHRTADDGLSIQPCSPAINTGIATGAPIEDITGYTRTGLPDIGAYEYNPTATPSIIYVKANATGSNNGTSWANAFTSLQSALAKAHACPGISEVWVAAGTYKPSAYPHGCSGCATDRDYTFHLRDGLKIYGGFAGTETSITARNIAANPTILSGDYNGDDVVTGGGATLSITGNGENAHHVVLASAAETTGIGVTVDGFSITGGNADGSSFITVNGNNTERDIGGGIFTAYGTNTLTNNTLYNNSAVAIGGGIYTYYGTNTLTNNTLYNNSAYYDGGGICTAFGTNTLTNNTLYNNSAEYGGGIYTYNNGTNTLSNNTLYNNSAEYGGGICTYYGTNTLKNNLFWANQKAGSNTTPGSDYENHSIEPATNTFTNNMLQLPNNTTNYPTTGNISGGPTTYTNNIYATDPLFINPADPDGADNIHRTADDGLVVLTHSSAVDNGTSAGAPTEDITGATRSTLPDIGAYEVSCSPTPRSVYLSGSNYVAVPGYTEINTFAGNQLTIEAWVSASSLKPQYWEGSIISKSAEIAGVQSGFDLRMGANGIDFNLGTGTGWQSAYYNFAPDVLRWYHVAGVFDGDSVKLYIDGQRVAALLYSGTFNNNTEPLFIGESVTWSGRNFHGRIDEVKVWNRALKPGELAYFSRHTHCNPYGLVAYFQFNEEDENEEPINPAPDATSPEDGSYIGARSCAGVEMLAPSSQLYVNAAATKSGDGSSWQQALKTLDEAIVASHYCTSIEKMHIAEGSYIPTYKPFEMWVGNEGREISTTSKRDATFHVRSGLEVLGGYQAATGDRNPSIYDTDIIGDINDGSNPDHDLYHVGMMVYKNTWDLNDTTIVDGLSFKNGKAEEKSSLTVNGQSISRSDGGGLYIHGGLNRISKSLFKINKSDTRGGGIYADGFEHLSLKHNTMDQNICDEGDGGGAYIQATGSGKTILAEGNLITQNTTDQRGGGVYQATGTNVSTWTSNLLYDNNAIGAASKGGGMYNNTSTAITMKNNVFSHNDAIYGGGLYGDKSNEIVINSTFANNVSDSGDGNAYYWDSNNGAIIRNCIFRENNAINIANPAMSHSIYQPGSTACTSCPGSNGSVNPDFLDANDPNGADNVYMTDDDGLTLKPSSVGLDAGDNTFIGSTPRDIKNGFRILGTIDIGAYESVSCSAMPSILYVDESRPVSGAGDAWISAFKTLDEALYIAHKCPDIEEIRVAQGTYKPQFKPYEIDMDKIGFEKSTSFDEDRTFHIRSGLVVKGGYATGGSATPDPESNLTILNGNIGAAKKVFHVALIDYANHWDDVSDKAKLEGFSIKNGKSATTTSTLNVNGASVPRNKGAGIISVNGNSYTLSSLHIESVIGIGPSKGIYHMSGSATLFNIKTPGLETAAGDVSIDGTDNVIEVDD